MRKGIISGLLALATLALGSVAHAALSCTNTTLCSNNTNIVFRMSSTSNAHAELPSNANYSRLVCCTGVTGVANSCTGNFAPVLNLAASTNSHVQEATQSGYANFACLSAPAGNTITVAYQAGDCTGYDTTVGSIAAVTNSHVGDANAYTTKICASISLPQSLSFSLSGNAIGFGSISPAATTYATSDLAGSATQVEAHSISAMTNATYGYTLYVQGATLTSGSNSITAIGGTNTAPATGTNQFGLRLVASGGTGAVTSPYDGTGFADAATANASSQVAGEATGDGTVTTYSARYVADAASNLPAGSYGTTFTYVITANF